MKEPNVKDLKKKVIEWVLSPRKVKSIIVDDPEIMRKLCH